MAVRLEQTIYDAEDQAWTIRVHDASWGGGSIGYDITGASVNYQSSTRERFAPILPSVADIQIRIDGATLEAFVTDLIGAAEKRFRLEIRKGAAQFWIGNILTDNIRRQDKERPYIFAIRATDGLASLKDVDYNNTGTDYTGRQRCTEHIVNCLNKIGTADLFSTAILSTAVTWYSAQHASTSVDPLHESRFDHRRYIKIDTGGKKTYYNCYEVLESVCEAFGARLFQSDGTFKVIQINEFEGANFALFNYDTSTVLDSTTAAATYSKTDATNITRLYGGNFEYFPALSKVIVRYTHFQAQSIIPGDAIAFADYTGPDVDSGGGTSKMLISFNYNFKAAFNTVSDFKALRFVIRLKIQVGTNYLTRIATVDSTTGAVSYSAVTWESSLNYFEIATTLSTVNNITFYGSLNNFVTPDIPADGVIVINGQYNRAYTASGDSISPTATASVNFYNAYFEIVAGGTLESRSNEFIYEVDNDLTDNSKKYEVNTEIGDGPSYTGLGALQVFGGVGWSVSNGWAQGNTSGTDEIGQLLAQEILLTQAAPVPIINATYNGFLSPLYAIYYQSEYHIPLSCSIDLIQGKVRGNFFRCDSNGSAITDKDKEAAFEPAASDKGISVLTPSQGSGSTDLIDGSGVSEAIRTSLIYKSRITGTSDDIVEGDPVTSIPVDAIGQDLVIREGDVISVVSVETGQTQSFTVTADVADTDTSISVSSTTADNDFPEGSIIVTDATEVLRTRKIRYRQRFVGQTVTTCTITENGGTLPTEDYIDVTYNGQELDTVDWNISGSDIILTFRPNGLIVVKFWI